MANHTGEKEIQLLKRYFGWDDNFITKLAPNDLESAYKIMELEEEDSNATTKATDNQI